MQAAQTIVKTPFTDPAASTDELQAMLRLEGEYSDEDVLNDLLMSATDYAQNYLGRSLTEQVLVRQFDPPKMSAGLSAVALKERPVLLTYPPVQSVNRVYLVDNYGDETTVDSDDYWLDDIKTPPELMITLRYWTGRLRIEYTAGYESVPEAIKRGVLLHAAHMWAYRGDVCSTEDAAKQSGAVAAYRTYRVMRT